MPWRAALLTTKTYIHWLLICASPVPRILLLIPALVIMGCCDEPTARKAASVQESPYFQGDPDVCAGPEVGGYHRLAGPVVCSCSWIHAIISRWLDLRPGDVVLRRDRVGKPCTPITTPIKIPQLSCASRTRTAGSIHAVAAVRPSTRDNWVYLFMKTDAALAKLRTRTLPRSSGPMRIACPDR